MTTAALLLALCAFGPLRYSVEVEASYGYGARQAFGAALGGAVELPLWDARLAQGTLALGTLLTYQAEPYGLTAGLLPGTRVWGENHRLQGLLLLGHAARLGAARRWLLQVDLFAGWTHLFARGGLADLGLGFSRRVDADAGRVTAGAGLGLGLRVTDSLSVLARLLAPLPFATEVNAYFSATVGVALAL